MNDQRIMSRFLLFILLFFSYGTAVNEISDLADEPNANPIIILLDEIYAFIHIVSTVFVLGLMLKDIGDELNR